uniref:Secreted protein n=1 Tax=Trichogramma kaykai TaxID=54128 RepID=A0ABD2XCL0_9HYME
MLFFEVAPTAPLLLIIQLGISGLPFALHRARACAHACEFSEEETSHDAFFEQFQTEFQKNTRAYFVCKLRPRRWQNGLD